jgi:predicted RNA binding protein with dsRBD fold (UPF0201 family)
MSEDDVEEAVLRVATKLPLSMKNIQAEVRTQILEGTSNLTERLRELIRTYPEIV